jgi:hypothetical protein
VQQLDLDTGEISCLARDDRFDFLWPRIGSDGTLYYIRRPNHSIPEPVTVWANLRTSLLGTVLLPFAILSTIGLLFARLAEWGAGRPLFTPKETVAKTVRTPASWLLMRQRAVGEAETIAERALSFDLAGDGSVIYSDGFDAYRLPPNGAPPTKILSGKGIELIAAL